ncbi:MAG: hypothetical protein U0P82_09680 [Vicinamibacterales bacterium]
MHRTPFERLIYRRVQQCSGCGRRTGERRIPLQRELAFVRSSHACCVECGSFRVRRLTRRDGIDRMSRHPVSLLAALVGAPIYHCNPCRVQFHDWRPLDPEVLQAFLAEEQQQGKTNSESRTQNAEGRSGR